MDRQYVVFLGLGFEILGLVVSMVYIGSLVDEHYHWEGMGVAAGAVLAMVAWLVHVIVILRRLDPE